MTKQQFDQLSLHEKYAAVTDKGTFIASRLFEGFQVHLFLINKLYVEVWRRAGFKQVEWIETVNSQQTLDKYLDNLDLNIEGLMGDK